MRGSDFLSGTQADQNPEDLRREEEEGNWRGTKAWVVMGVKINGMKDGVNSEEKKGN